MGLTSKDFDAKAITQVEDMYHKAQITLEQRKMLEPFGKLISKYVPINEMAIRGFCLMGVVEWQKRHNKPVSVLEQGTPQERIAAMQELTVNLAITLKKILHTNGPEKEKLVDKGIIDLMEFYVQQFSKR